MILMTYFRENRIENRIQIYKRMWIPFALRLNGLNPIENEIFTFQLFFIFIHIYLFDHLGYTRYCEGF